MCNLAPSNCHISNNHMPKRSVTENKMCNYHTTKLNMESVGVCVCVCDPIPFIVRPESMYQL